MNSREHLKPTQSFAVTGQRICSRGAWIFRRGSWPSATRGRSGTHLTSPATFRKHFTNQCIVCRLNGEMFRSFQARSLVRRESTWEAAFINEPARRLRVDRACGALLSRSEWVCSPLLSFPMAPRTLGAHPPTILPYSDLLASGGYQSRRRSLTGISLFSSCRHLLNNFRHLARADGFGKTSEIGL
jgi:hypothetical protein